MKVGVPTEIKVDEYRVALTPAGVRELGDRGHEVVVQSGAGEGSGLPDAVYASQGARIAPDAPSRSAAPVRATTRRAARSRRGSSARAPRATAAAAAQAPSRPTATSGPSSCCSRCRTTTP